MLRRGCSLSFTHNEETVFTVGPSVTMLQAALFWLFLLRVQSSVPPVFVQKGKDVLLEVDNVTENFFVFVWKFDEESSSLVTFGRDGTSEISPAYTGRIDIPDNKKYSVILKNLQETDSGVYTGRLTTFKGDFPLVQHNIIVQDVVSPVQLEVNSVSSSSHSCNVTLTCSTADSHISSTFRCIDQKCDQDGGNQSKITNSSSTLEVYLWNVTVICKHRNQVSSTEDRTDIQHVCPQLTDAVQHRNHENTWIAVGVSVPLFIVVGFLGAYLYRKRTADHGVTHDNTVYAVPTVETPESPAEAPDTDETSGLSPVSTDSGVRPHSGSSAAAETNGKPVIDIVYAQVQKHVKP
ncbi:uncharacterized protein LOC115404883 isoform X7 [Salarias fasciatus]|uniref:uncharacterized protein LOC115404883 isoform X7 n=1 Tax=Salarias fasciatus TaxID=181472 RepID=UPI0011764F75|nr:uncharacterized protein LOC115404883 isoform X7 [Salarias fasciatus]